MLAAIAELPEALRHEALTHPAWAPARISSYERLEFLGDAVLGAIITEELCRRFPDWSEGDLAKLKARVVSRDTCAEVAQQHGFPTLMIESVDLDDDRPMAEDLQDRRNVRAALTESLTGAIFQHAGYDAAKTFVLEVFAGHIEGGDENRRDWKSELQEWAQQRGASVSYRMIGVDGPDHDRQFTMEVGVSEVNETARGNGTSKKAAEQEAARQLLSIVS